MPKVYEDGSTYDVLARFGDALFKRTDFPDSDADLGGTVGWCPVQLTKLVVLQAKHGWSDRETVQRASTDMQVKACLGLGIEQRGPSQPTLCRHRQQMQALNLDVRYQERLRALLLSLELVHDEEPVLIDSVPVKGAGQHQDTDNLLGSAPHGAACMRGGTRCRACAHTPPALVAAARSPFSLRRFPSSPLFPGPAPRGFS